MEFYIIVDINVNKIQYVLLMKQADNFKILHQGNETNWITSQGIIYDYYQLNIIINHLKGKIYNLYDIDFKKIIITLSIPGIQLINYHQQIHKNENTDGVTLYTNHKDYYIIHNCGRLYIIDENIPMENIQNINYNTLDIYENHLIINESLAQQIIHQMDTIPLDNTQIYSPHYLLATGISYHLNMDIILIDIQFFCTIITINHHKFSYGYWYWNQGTSNLKKNDENNFNNFLLDLQSIIKNYPKATVIIGGYKPLDFNWIFYLQKLCSNKIFYLSQLTNNHNNIFFSLMDLYPQMLIINQNNSAMIDKLEDIIL